MSALTPFLIICGSAKVESKVKQIYGKTATELCKSTKEALFQRHKNIKRNERG